MGRVLRPISVVLMLFSIATGGNDPYPVTGVIGGTIELVFRQNFPHYVKDIVWKQIMGSQLFKIAELKDNKLETVHPHFQNRLEKFGDVMGLRIKNASFNDRGIYIAKITLENDRVHEESFNVSLYEPVPAPNITIDYEKGTSDICNVTLHCYVQGNTTPLSYTWEYRHDDSDYQLYNSTGDTIQMSLQPGFSDMEVLCTVWNPADRKNISYTLKSCQCKETHQNQLWWLLAFLVVILLLCAAAFKIRCKEELKLSVPETNNGIALPEIYIDPNEDMPFQVPENAVKYSKCFFSVHEEKKLLQCIMQDDKIELEDSEHPSIFPVKEDSENEEEC